MDLINSILNCKVIDGEAIIICLCAVGLYATVRYVINTFKKKKI